MSSVTSEYKDLLISLAKLHYQLTANDIGENYYHQFTSFHKLNGDSCPLLPILADRLPIDFIEPQLEELINAFRKYQSSPK